ncbi:MAG: glycosyltransferase family 4 protein, partial [Gemmatimonadales bacterium]
IPNAGELLGAFDSVVLSSRTEGLPISVLETMSAGVPLVATRVGDIPAVTSDGKYAALVDPDDPSALAAAIDRSLTDRDRAMELAREASEWVKIQFGMDAWLDRISATYESAMQRRAER